MASLRISSKASKPAPRKFWLRFVLAQRKPEGRSTASSDHDHRDTAQLVKVHQEVCKACILNEGKEPPFGKQTQCQRGHAAKRCAKDGPVPHPQTGPQTQHGA